jgi:hypothetical protein
MEFTGKRVPVLLLRLHEHVAQNAAQVIQKLLQLSVLCLCVYFPITAHVFLLM